MHQEQKTKKIISDVENTQGGAQAPCREFPATGRGRGGGVAQFRGEFLINYCFSYAEIMS